MRALLLCCCVVLASAHGTSTDSETETDSKLRRSQTDIGAAATATGENDGAYNPRISPDESEAIAMVEVAGGQAQLHRVRAKSSRKAAEKALSGVLGAPKAIKKPPTGAAEKSKAAANKNKAGVSSTKTTKTETQNAEQDTGATSGNDSSTGELKILWCFLLMVGITLLVFIGTTVRYKWLKNTVPCLANAKEEDDERRNLPVQVGSSKISEGSRNASTRYEIKRLQGRLESLRSEEKEINSLKTKLRELRGLLPADKCGDSERQWSTFGTLGGDAGSLIMTVMEGHRTHELLTAETSKPVRMFGLKTWQNMATEQKTVLFGDDADDVIYVQPWCPSMIGMRPSLVSTVPATALLAGWGPLAEDEKAALKFGGWNQLSNAYVSEWNVRYFLGPDPPQDAPARKGQQANFMFGRHVGAWDDASVAIDKDRCLFFITQSDSYTSCSDFWSRKWPIVAAIALAVSAICVVGFGLVFEYA